MRFHIPFSSLKEKILILLLGAAGSFIIAVMTAALGIVGPILLIALAGAVFFLVAVCFNPKIGFITYICYTFFIPTLLKHNPAVPFGPLMEGLLLLTWLSVGINHFKFRWTSLRNQHCILALVWFIINLIEVVNPAGASILGWFNEIRSTSVTWLLIAPLPFLLFDKKKDLDLFIYLIIGLSSFATIYGMKQLYIGLTAGEQAWLDAGNDLTHIIFGKLRVFSFFTDAGQFGASQAHIGLIALVLTFGSFKWWKKLLLAVAAGLLIYGMMISGSRGALFALVSGLFVAIFLSKRIKILIIGSLIALSALYLLKYTTIGNSWSYHIVRLRTSMDPEDPSLNVRFRNQKILREILASMPFGGGVGVSGTNGTTYNQDKLLSTVPPDSYWVKVWVMYGIVGFVVWFSIMTFIMGKCCGLIWNIKDPHLKVKLIALVSGSVGVFICSYGNEVINVVPSSMIVYISWSFAFLGVRFDKESENSDIQL